MVIGDEVRIGARLRAARRQRGMTIDQLAKSTGLTKGFLSQVERDLANVSVASLLKVCGVLGIRIGDLFDDEESGLVTADARPAVEFGGVGVCDHLLTPRSNRRIQIIHSVVHPGGRSEGESYPTPSDAQVVHVTSGEFELVIDDVVHVLQAGDSLTFTGRERRAWRNPSATRDAEVLWVITPSLF